MNIASTQYTLEYMSFDIYVSGCKGQPHCEGCHNRELWDFDVGVKFDDKYKKVLTRKIIQCDNMINNIMIFGGEPLDQKVEELIDMLNWLRQFDKVIWLFTRFEINDVDIRILTSCDFIKTGRYIKDMATDDNWWHGVNLASSNQKIHELLQLAY